MAGDWIRMRTSLLTNPKVNGIARELESNPQVSRALAPGHNGVMSQVVTRCVMRHVTVSSLLVIWGAANEHTKDGIFENADLADINDMVGIPCFAEAMQAVGWLEYDEENFCVILPNFNEYNTSGAERSATAKTSAQRQKEYRDRKKQQSDVTRDVTNNVTRDVTNDVTSNRREEKRREEDIKEKIPSVSKKKSKIDPDMILPDAWKTDAELYWSTSKRPDLIAEEQFFKFKNYHSAKGSLMLDWSAAWRTWYANATGFQNARASPSKSNIFDLTNQNYASGDL